MGEFERGSGGDLGSGAPSRLGVLQNLILAEASRLAVPVSLNVLCRSAAVQLDVAAVAVSLPSVIREVIGIETLAAFGPLARLGEELQFTVGQGPSMEVLSRSGPLLVEDLDTPEQQARWPLFAPAAVEAGIASLCVIPMRIGAARFGAFVVYLDRVGGLSPTGLGDVAIFAVLALDLLLDHLDVVSVRDLDGGGRYDAAGLDAAGLGAAGSDGAGADGETGRGGAFDRWWTFDDRPEIHQATGMICEQLGVDMPTALMRLRARSFADGRMLSELAADVVARIVRLDNDPGTEPEGGPP